MNRERTPLRALSVTDAAEMLPAPRWKTPEFIAYYCIFAWMVVNVIQQTLLLSSGTLSRWIYPV
jgi:hypothetical protein